MNSVDELFSKAFLFMTTEVRILNQRQIWTYPGFSQTLLGNAAYCRFISCFLRHSILRLCMLHLNNHKILKYLKIKKSMTPILEIPNSHTAINTYITMLSLNIKNARKVTSYYWQHVVDTVFSFIVYRIRPDSFSHLHWHFVQVLPELLQILSHGFPLLFLLLHIACQMTCAALYCKNY